MRVAHVIPYLGRAQGGPVFGLAAYCSALVDAGCEVEVLGGSQTSEGDLVWFDSRVPVRSFDANGWGSFRRCPGLNRALSETNCDLIHSHGLWTDVHRSAAAQARKRGLPHLLATCGMLAPGARERHWWKKLPARLWFQDRALREAQCLHAKSSQEYEHIRQFGLRNPVAIIPNPIAMPPVGAQRAGGVVRSPQSTVHSPQPVVPHGRTVLFLGRLHPVKGLSRLLQAWGRIQNEKAENGSFKSRNLESRKQKAGERQGDGRWERGEGTAGKWVLVLAGPDEGGYRKELERLVGELGCGGSVVFTGELDDAQKWEALAAADLFVMPSDFENFGNAIVEAMMAGLPVITTTGTPWKELPVAGAGWWVEPTVDAMTVALREALALPEETRREMGRQALTYSARFRPEQAASDLIQVYQWLLGRGAKPECVAV